MLNDGVKLYGVKGKRIRALNRLQEQLSSGTKPSKQSKGLVYLLDKDKDRIEKEIAILKSKI